MQNSRHTWRGRDDKHRMRFLIPCLFCQHDKRENHDDEFELSGFGSWQKRSRNKKDLGTEPLEGGDSVKA